MDRLGGNDPLRHALRPRGPVQFVLSEYERPDATVLHVEGELDALTAPQLTARLAAVIRRHTGDVVVDLRGTEFIDSVGLSVLLAAHRRLVRASRGLVVVCEDGPVRRAIEQARLVDTFGVVASLDHLI